jgi:hypothetical protein
MNYKIAGKSVDTETQETLEKMSRTPNANTILGDGEVSSADEANALLNVVSDNVIDDADYDKINRGLSVNNHIYHDQFANLAKVFEEKFPRNGLSGFKGLTRFGINPYSPVKFPLQTTEASEKLKAHGITTELYKYEGKERVLVKHGHKEIFHLETDTHVEGLKVTLEDNTLSLYLKETELPPEKHVKTIQLDDVASAPKKASSPEKISPDAKTSSDGQSTSSVPHTVADVLKALEEILGPSHWTIPGEIGEKFLSELPSLTEELPKLDTWLSSKADLGPEGVAKINEFLEKNGYSGAKLDPSGVGKHDVVAASILDMKFSWENPAEATKMTLASGNEVDAVKMKGVNIYQSEVHRAPIARIPTKQEGVFVCLTRHDGSFSPDDPLAVYDYAGGLANDINRDRADWKGPAEVMFPMVDYNKSGDMDWLKGAATLDANGNPVTISQAKYQHKFKLDEKGVEAGGAAAVSGTRGMTPKPVVIDGPFVAWVEVNGVVAFAGYMDESVMKDPK